MYFCFWHKFCTAWLCQKFMVRSHKKEYKAVLNQFQIGSIGHNEVQCGSSKYRKIQFWLCIVLGFQKRFISPNYRSDLIMTCVLFCFMMQAGRIKANECREALRSWMSVFNSKTCMVCYFFVRIWDVRRDIDVILVCICVLIFVMRFCWTKMTDTDMYAYFCCCGLYEYEYVGFLEGALACSLL